MKGRRRAGERPVQPGSVWHNVVLLTLVALLPVALLAVSSIALASHEVTSDVNKQVQTTAAVSSVVIGTQTTDLVLLLHSYATRPSLASGVLAGASGSAEVDGSLASLAKATPGVSAAFVVSLQGTSLDVYPSEPSIIGTSFKYRDWYTGLVSSGRPYVSPAIVTKEVGNPLAVTVTDYITGANGIRIGIVGIEYSLSFVKSFAATIGGAQGVNLIVTDQAGTSLTAGNTHALTSLLGDPDVRAARAGHSGLRDYAPALPDGKPGIKELSAYAPVAGTGWTVIASVPASTAFAGLNRLRDTVLVITAVLVLVLLAGVRFLARSERRRRQSDYLVRSRDRELAKVLEATDESFVSIDGAGAITAWNAQAEQLYGWRASDVLGHNLVETVIPPESRELYEGDLAGYRTGSESVVVGRRVEMMALHKDGHEIPVEVGVWAHEDGEGFSAFVHDISERVATVAELESARDQAMAASRMKSEFLANMSHEIRTPMNGVIGMSNLLLNTQLSAEQREYAETVCTSGEALLTVIEDILDFSKIEAGKLDVERVSFDCRAVIEESVALLAASAHQNGLELTCRIDSTMPVALMGDPGRLRQVLLNLLGNAVKFTSVGEVNLTAGVADAPAANGVVIELSIRDTGIGMTPATMEHLFDAFTQADASTSRRFGGTGLGLAISRQLVELMGGTLSVVSELGSGSTFRAVIPFAIGNTATSRSRTTDLHGVRALIVDDNSTNQRILQEIIAEWGCTSSNADGAKSALVVLREAAAGAHPFDVILLDLNMPGTDGYGLARMVRTDPQLIHIPMIMLTSSAQRGEAERTREAGIVAYLTKPVRVALLWDALNIALSHASPKGSMSPGAEVGRHPLPALTPSDREGRGGAELSDRPATADSSNPLPGSPVLLLVEDNIVNQKVGVAMLNDLGYRVEVATDGANALEALASRAHDYYSAILMDCQMPFMDGYETTQQLRQGEPVGRHALVIAVTASAMAADRERCLDAGMDDYLTKPLRLEALRAMLNRWELGGSPHLAAPHEAEELPAPIDVPDESVGTPRSVLDADVLSNLSRLGSDAGVDLVGQLATLFLVDADSRVAAMRQGLVASDPMAVVESAHALRGASANIGATDLAWVCETLELSEGADEPENAGKLWSGVRSVAAELELVRSALAARSTAG